MPDVTLITDPLAAQLVAVVCGLVALLLLVVVTWVGWQVRQDRREQFAKRRRWGLGEPKRRRKRPGL